VAAVAARAAPAQGERRIDIFVGERVDGAPR
jgi:hypothetical protein